MGTDADRSKRRSKQVRLDPAHEPGRKSVNLSLRPDEVRRLKALAIHRGTTASALVGKWIAAESVGLVFYVRSIGGGAGDGGGPTTPEPTPPA